MTLEGPQIGGEVNQHGNRVKSALNRTIMVKTDYSSTGFRAGETIGKLGISSKVKYFNKNNRFALSFEESCKVR